MTRHNRYSSWLTIIDNIANDQVNLDLTTRIYNQAVAQYGWSPLSGKKLRALVTIQPGVKIYSTNPLLPALTVNPATAGGVAFRNYDLIVLTNNGTIAGASGVAGAAGSQNGGNGGDGGTAIRLNRPIIIANAGDISGGGGGGGGGGGHIFKEHVDPGDGCGAGNTYTAPAGWACAGGAILNPGTCYDTGSVACIAGNCGGDCTAAAFLIDTNNYCGSGGVACTINSDCGCTRTYESQAGSCTRDEEVNCCNALGNPRGTCRLTHNYTRCLSDSTSCFSQDGAFGGTGRGYNGLGNLINILGSASPGAGRGFGGNGGDWGQDGEDGEAGTTPATGNPETLRVDAGAFGLGGFAGISIQGNGFLLSRSGNGVIRGPEQA